MIFTLKVAIGIIVYLWIGRKVARIWVQRAWDADHVDMSDAAFVPTIYWPAFILVDLFGFLGSVAPDKSKKEMK